MILRYWLRNRKLRLAAEAPATPAGLALLRALRRADARFRRRRITEVMQACPSEMPPFGTVFPTSVGRLPATYHHV